MIKRLLVVVSILLLTACALRPPVDNQPRTWLKPGVRVTLPAPSLEPALQQQQLLSAEIKGQTHALVVLLNADQNGITLAGLSSLGIRLFRIIYDQDGIQTEQAIVLANVPPAGQILSDIMFSYWPLEAWQQRLPKGWQLQDEAPTLRTLRDDKNKEVISITYAVQDGLRQPVEVHHHVFNYRIGIQVLGQ